MPAILAYILSQVLTVYVITAILRIRKQEAMTRTELVLASSASRLRYAAGHLFVAFIGSASTGDFWILYRGFGLYPSKASRGLADRINYCLFV